MILLALLALAIPLLAADDSPAQQRQDDRYIYVFVNDEPLAEPAVKPGDRVHHTVEVTVDSTYTPTGPLKLNLGAGATDRQGNRTEANPIVSFTAPPGASCGDPYVLQPAPIPNRQAIGDWVISCDVTIVAGQTLQFAVVAEQPPAGEVRVSSSLRDPNSFLVDPAFSDWIFSLNAACERAKDAVAKAKKKLQQADSEAAKAQAKKKLKAANKKQRKAC